MKNVATKLLVTMSIIFSIISCKSDKKANTGAADLISDNSTDSVVTEMADDKMPDTDLTEKKLDSYRLIDSIMPGLTPKVFAEGIISLKNRFEQYCSFSPDGMEFHFSYTDSAWMRSTMVQINLLNPLQPERIILTESDYQSGQFIDPTGKKLYFTSILFSGGIWHSDIYVATKSGGKWVNPLPLNEPVNSYICEWHPTLTNKGTMYFSSERNYDHELADIYKSVPENGNYIKAGKLPAPINTDINETDPLIAPDESFLIFASNRPKNADSIEVLAGMYGSWDLDLYISFNLGNAKWTTPKNMKKINSDSWEFAPALSPDGKYLFFTRRENFRTLTPSKIYWVDSKVIDLYR